MFDLGAVRAKTTRWDAADGLDSIEAIAAYLDAVLEDGDPALIAAALGDIARAKGMTQLARDTGLAREALYKALSSAGNPEFATVLKVVRALGLRLHALPPPRAKRPAKRIAKRPVRKAVAAIVRPPTTRDPESGGQPSGAGSGASRRPRRSKS